MEDNDKIQLSNNNLFWGCWWYRGMLEKSGVDLLKYVRPDGTNIKEGYHDTLKRCRCCRALVCGWKNK